MLLRRVYQSAGHFVKSKQSLGKNSFIKTELIVGREIAIDFYCMIVPKGAERKVFHNRARRGLFIM